MKCRNLAEDKYYNIVWFGSHGKNENYVLKEFVADANGNLTVKSNGEIKRWENVYNECYMFAWGPYENISAIFGAAGIKTNKDYYDPSSPDPDDIEGIWYFKADESDGLVYIPLKEMPDDWETDYRDYYVIKFKKNEYKEYLPSPTKYFFHDNKLPAENYALDGEAVRVSLIQRLSVIKGELWYKASYGLPLTEKVKNKNIYDSIIISIITQHSGIANLLSYSSYIENRKYHFGFRALTVFGEELAIDYAI